MLDKYFPLYLTVFIIALLATALIERLIIPRLIAVAKQPIYTEGPTWHIKKSGTPTMGGIAFLIAAIISILPAGIFLCYASETYSVVSLSLSLSYALLNSFIGIIDDVKKLRRKEKHDRY